MLQTSIDELLMIIGKKELHINKLEVGIQQAETIIANLQAELETAKRELLEKTKE